MKVAGYNWLTRLKKWQKVFIGFGLLVVIFFTIRLPDPLFEDPTATILEDSTGRLLCARIATDGQWRFPELQQVPEKFAASILTFEDQRFYHHPGIDLLAVARAIRQNLEKKRIVSGASTLTMQLIRLSRKGKPRTLTQKFIEAIWALRAEVRYSKQEILALYASYAPFGGNVVGLDAAAWRYYGVAPGNLSWGQAAALAVLPNAPAAIRPGVKEKIFREKRNKLLQKLLEKETIDSITYQLACLEPLPGRPLPIPDLGLHLLNHIVADGKRGQRIQSTLSYNLQRAAQQVVQRHYFRLRANKIYNAAALILDTETGNVLAYIGNVDDGKNSHNNLVDVVTAPRSSGSTLKPFLYAAMLDEGIILPRTLITDVPVNIDGYSPKNFSNRYDGAVPADEVLYRSLNVPMVRMLKEFGLQKFHHLLRKMNFSTIKRPPNHYGLSLILGGGEVTLWDLAGAYASMARTLKHYNQNGTYYGQDFRQPTYLSRRYVPKESYPKLKASGIYLAFEAMTHLNRPEQESGWKHFVSSRKIAWKTGTSFGFRDGWAVGVTPEYTVAVWTGNADGEGRPGLTGLSAAAPIMMDLFRLLPQTSWFQKPYDEMIEVAVCRESGRLASDCCDHVDTLLVSENAIRSESCKYHQHIFLDAEKEYRVNRNCYDADSMIAENRFVLPPTMEWYYRQVHPEYQGVPPIHPNCDAGEDRQVMEIIYPDNLYDIFIPRELGGEPGAIILKAAHRNQKAVVYWYVDQHFLGETQGDHQMDVKASAGMHTLTLTDDQGNTQTMPFNVVKE